VTIKGNIETWSHKTGGRSIQVKFNVKCTTNGNKNYGHTRQVIA